MSTQKCLVVLNFVLTNHINMYYILCCIYTFDVIPGLLMSILYIISAIAKTEYVI